MAPTLQPGKAVAIVIMESLRIARRWLSGFTLIEALVALLILAFVLGGVGYLMISSVRTDRSARQLTAAVNLARDRMELLCGMPYASLANGGDGPLNESGGTSGGVLMYSRAWTVVANTGASGGPPTGTSTVTVVTSWTDQDGATHQVQLQTILKS